MDVHHPVDDLPKPQTGPKMLVDVEDQNKPVEGRREHREPIAFGFMPFQWAFYRFASFPFQSRKKAIGTKTKWSPSPDSFLISKYENYGRIDEEIIKDELNINYDEFKEVVKRFNIKNKSIVSLKKQN